MVSPESPYVRWKTPCLCLVLLSRYGYCYVSRCKWRLRLGLVVTQKKGQTVGGQMSLEAFYALMLWAISCPPGLLLLIQEPSVSCLHGLALLAAEPTTPCELLPSISGVQGVGSVHGWSDMMQCSSTPGLSLAVCILLAGELSCRQEQLHETTRSLASLCHLPAELTWQPNACKSYPQRALSPCL